MRVIDRIVLAVYRMHAGALAIAATAAVLVGGIRHVAGALARGALGKLPDLRAAPGGDYSGLLYVLCAPVFGIGLVFAWTMCSP